MSGFATVRRLPWLAVAACVTACQTQAPEAARLRSAGQVLAAAPELAGARVAFLVVDTGTRRELAAAEAHRGLLPASNQKLITAAVALETLGGEATLPTELLATGPVRDGVLEGDLVLRGHGDPSFGVGASGDAVLAAFAAALRARGVREIAGRVRGDGSWLGDERLGRGWQWDHLGDDFAAPFGGLCCAGNVLEVRLRPTPAGPAMQVVPVADELPILRVAMAAPGAPTELVATRPIWGGSLEVRGTLAADAPEQVLRVPVADPAAFAAQVLLAVLRREGIAVRGGVLSAGESWQVAVHESPPLGALVAAMLRDSDNLAAEQLWRVAARTLRGNGSSATAELHSRAVLARLGVAVDGLVLADGSGLSRRNLVQPAQLVQLLVAMQQSPQSPAFLAGLPIAGRTGTLRARFAQGPATGQVLAKTGTLARVQALSGYVLRPNGAAPWAFSVVVENHTCSDATALAALDAFVGELASAAGW
ncbi:MAG: D-alanyl-D-alanine carboxypeptidase/D-alanyl-D-alanine-endopeptidase [Planctomycetes bacterium]|nr:D-alanyl-D-alanine carboxypeptidase/D-alanyl-D-alanine-endopeptidase [Planctomycetota bacterium]